MTRAFSVEISIAQPQDQVWERLTDWGTAQQWMPGVEALRAEGPTAVGTVLVFTSRGKERQGQIASLVPGQSITLRSCQGPVTADYVYACASQGQGTNVTLVADCSITGPMRVLGPLIRYAIRRADSGQLDAFAGTFSRTPA